jgi:hypothetical protein
MKALTGLVGSPKPTAVQAVTPAPALPQSDEEQLRKARKKAAVKVQTRSGRDSTFLSGDGDKLGG